MFSDNPISPISKNKWNDFWPRSTSQNFTWNPKAGVPKMIGYQGNGYQIWAFVGFHSELRDCSPWLGLDRRGPCPQKVSKETPAEGSLDVPEGSENPQKAPRRLPGGSQKAPKRFPESFQKAPRRHPDIILSP